MPRSSRYLSRLVAVDEPARRARAPYRRGWGVVGATSAELNEQRRDAVQRATLPPSPAVAQPTDPMVPHEPEKPSPAPRVTPVPAVEQKPLPPPTAAPDAPSMEELRGAGAPMVRPATDTSGPPRIPAEPPNRAVPRSAEVHRRNPQVDEMREPTPRVRASAVPDQPRTRPPTTPARAVAVLPQRLRSTQVVADPSATSPRAAVERQRFDVQLAAVPSIHIGTIDVRIAAAPPPSPVPVSVPPHTEAPAAPVGPLSRPAAVFGFAQG